MRKNLTYSFLNAAMLTGCIFLWTGCNSEKEKKKEKDARKFRVEEAKNIHLNYTIGGKIKSVVTSPLMLNVEDIVPYIEFPSTIHADFYDDFGKRESFLDARYAKYEQNKSTVFIKDSVVVINIEKGDTLYCNELYWDRNRTGNEFYTDKPVRIRTRKEWINGKGMEAAQDFRNWHITQSVGVIGVPKSRFPE